MRAISIQQPWAHLVVLGLKRVEVRTWTREYSGRLAVHASTNVVWQDVERVWDTSEEVARVFAELGWRSRADLKALPRSAIVGTVEFRGAHLGRALHKQNAKSHPASEFDEALYAALGRAGGGFGWKRAKVEPIPVVIPDDQYAWTFARPVAIEPVEDVAGQQHLWAMPKDVDALVKEREQRARNGEWRAPLVDPARRRRAMADWGRRWGREDERTAMKYFAEAFWELQLDLLTFPEELAERQFRRGMKMKREQSGVVVPGAGLHIRVDPELRQLFGGRSLVRALEYEATVRRAVHTQVIDDRAHNHNAWVYKQMVDLVRELRLKAGRKPMSSAEIAKEVKAVFKRGFVSQMNTEARFDRMIEIPEY